MVAHHSQRVALTRVNIRAPALAFVRHTGWQRHWVEASAAILAPRQRISSLTARHTATSSSLLRDAIGAELRAARYTARHAARKPFRWTAAVAAAAAVGAIAASAGAAPVTSAASGLAADEHAASGAARDTAVAGPAASSEPTSGSRVELTSRDLAVRRADTSVQAAVRAAVHPALQPMIHAATTAGSTAAHAAAGHRAPAHHATTPKHASTTPKHGTTAVKPASKPAGPTVIYDSVTPSAIPAGKAVAAYSNGTYQASPAQVAGHGKVLWIDVHGSNTSADALDVEPGDATPASAAAWASAKLTKDPDSTAIIYTFKAAWGPVISNINALPGWMHSHVKYWIADPTGTPHILPGAAATQWYWGASYDISSAQPGFTS
jgi:hypothetical protein